MSIKFVTCIAPSNVSIIKYWGKRDGALCLPLNDSLSGTLSTDQIFSKITVAMDYSFNKDRIWINGKEENIDTPKIQKILNIISKSKFNITVHAFKARARSQGNLTSEELSWNLHICLETNYLSVSLLGSTSDQAGLVYSLAQLYNIKDDMSEIVRQRSSRACRSLYGGFVQWISGTAPDGNDSIAKQIVDEKYWPEMHVLILVVRDGDTDRETKTISTTAAMKNSVETSELLKYRTCISVPDRILKITKAIKEKDYQTFAEITMKESNQMHGICLDTFPPCVYMNDVSHAIADLIHQINKDAGKYIVSYTYDTSPHAYLYLLEQDVSTVVSAINHIFFHTKSFDEYFKGIPIQIEPLSNNFPTVSKREPWAINALRYIIHTKIGEGPKNISTTENLLNELGLPKTLKKIIYY